MWGISRLSMRKQRNGRSELRGSCCCCLPPPLPLSRLSCVVTRAKKKVFLLLSRFFNLSNPKKLFLLLFRFYCLAGGKKNEVANGGDGFLSENARENKERCGKTGVVAWEKAPKRGDANPPIFLGGTTDEKHAFFTYSLFSFFFRDFNFPPKSGFRSRK